VTLKVNLWVFVNKVFYMLDVFLSLSQQFQRTEYWYGIATNFSSDCFAESFQQ